MRYLSLVGLTASLLVAGGPATAAIRQTPSAPGASSLAAVIDRVVRAESELKTRMATYHPVAEVYIQNLVRDRKVGPVPVRDDYYIGQYDSSVGPALDELSPRRGWFRPPGLMNRLRGVSYVPAGFAAMTMPDREVLDAERYDFAFVRREFLDEVRCLVFEVRPKAGDRDGFKGRVWVDDRDFAIVRYNGVSREADRSLSRLFRRKLTFHVDGWRVNVRPGVWLPAYVYFEDTDGERPTPPQVPRIRGQMRLWGYELKDANASSAFAAIEVDASIRDTSEAARPISPVLGQRSWERQAENNVLERLTKAGLLAPEGPVDAVLTTVLDNLQVTNDLAYDPPLRCRVLLTSPLEAFTVGRTIVLSRGLIDVLPDESSLALMLGHELAHVAVGHLLVDTKFAFADRLMIPDGDVVPAIRLTHTAEEEAEANAKLLELLERSPYKDRLAAAGLFLRAVGAHAGRLANLIQPHMGDELRADAETLRPLVEKSPPLEPERIDQIAVLPLGGRVALDPWSNRLELIRTAAVPLSWAREKLPLAIAPMAPYLRYAAGPPTGER